MGEIDCRLHHYFITITLKKKNSRGHHERILQEICPGMKRQGKLLRENEVSPEILSLNSGQLGKRMVEEENFQELKIRAKSI